jgi:hypothetical protein
MSSLMVASYFGNIDVVRALLLHPRIDALLKDKVSECADSFLKLLSYDVV